MAKKAVVTEPGVVEASPFTPSPAYAPPDPRLAVLDRLAQLGAKRRDGQESMADSMEVTAIITSLAGPAPVGGDARLAQYGPERQRPEPARVRQEDMKANRGKFIK